MLLTGVLLTIARTSGRAESPAEALLKSPRPLVIGHRGFSMIAPENTRAAFERALLAGVDLVELDYYHSRDGVPIVIHDGTLDRTTDAVARWGGKDIAIGDRTAAELTSLDAGKWFKPPFPNEKLPTLEQALDLIQSRGMTLIERKGGDAATLHRLLTAKSLVNRLVVQSFDWNFLRDYHRLDPGQVLAALGPLGSRAGKKLTDDEKALNRAWLEEVRDSGARIAAWNRQVDAAAVREAHAMGLKVLVYTIDEPDVAAQLLAAGVDGIISNNPAIIWKVIAEKTLVNRN